MRKIIVRFFTSNWDDDMACCWAESLGGSIQKKDLEIWFSWSGVNEHRIDPK